MKQLDEYRAAYCTPWNKRFEKIHSTNFYYNPLASKQNMEKLSASKLYWFIAGVIDTSDYPLHSNIFANFWKNSKRLEKGIQGQEGTDLEKKQKAINLVSDSL